MKFWQLASVCSSSQPTLTPELIASLVCAEPRNEVWAASFSRFDELVRVQDRTVLDTDLPDDLVRLVLGKVVITLYLSSDGWLRVQRAHPDDKALSVRGAVVPIRVRARETEGNP